jgi:hypothetical protein
MSSEPTPWPKRVASGLLLAFVAVTVVYSVVLEIQARRAAATATGQSATVGAGRTVVATYFYGRIRCITCQLIEQSAKDIIALDFADDLAAGRLAWQAINFENPGNEHYAQDYELAAQSLVLSEYKDGVQVRWKNLEKVWETISDQERFRAYINNEVKAFLAGKAK